MKLFSNPFKRRQPGEDADIEIMDRQTPPETPRVDPDTGPLRTTRTANGEPLIEVAGETLQLVNYSPTELVRQVEHNMSRVEFGWTRSTKFMENYAELWSVIGPLILLLGTCGEVFLVLWLRQKAQDVLAGLSIVAVAAVLEGTFLSVSYKAATIRNRADRRETGWTKADKRKTRRQLAFWFGLALGVCATQIIFIAAQTKPDGIGEVGVWTFAILRAVFTLVADGYTAFAHEQKPTSSEQALDEQEERAKAASKFLDQKQDEIARFNKGILGIHEAQNDAKIKQVREDTRLETEKLQAKALIDAQKAQQEMATLMVSTMTNISRALFDPKMDDKERAKLLSVMQGMADAQKILPEPGYKINEEDEED